MVVRFPGRAHILRNMYLGHRFGKSLKRFFLGNEEYPRTTLSSTSFVVLILSKCPINCEIAERGAVLSYPVAMRKLRKPFLRQ